MALLPAAVLLALSKLPPRQACKFGVSAAAVASGTDADRPRCCCC